MATMTCLCTILPLLLVIGWLLYNVKLLEATTAGTHGHDDLQLHVRSDASRHLRNLRRKGKCATNQVHRLSASANFFLQYHLVANFFRGATWLPTFSCSATWFLVVVVKFILAATWFPNSSCRCPKIFLFTHWEGVWLKCPN